MNSAKSNLLRAAFLAIVFAVAFGPLYARADGEGDLRAARQSSLQQQLATYEAEQAEAGRRLSEAMRSGSPAIIEQYSRQVNELGDRISSVRSELASLGGTVRVSRASSGLAASTPSFTSSPAGAPDFASTPSSPSVPSRATAPAKPAPKPVPAADTRAATTVSASTTSATAAVSTSTPVVRKDPAADLTPPTITQLDEAAKILSRYEEYRAEESGLGRRSRGTTTTTFSSAASTGTTTGPPKVEVQLPPDIAALAGGATAGDTASLAMRREMGKLMGQQQEIGREADELQRQLTIKIREQAALERMDQQDQASALQQEIDQLNQRFLAAQAENARIQQSSQQLAQDVETAAQSANVSGPAEDSGLQQMGRAGSPMPDDGRFKAGDKLQLIVTQDPSFNGTFELVSSGVILPQLGRIPIIGLTVPEAEQGIKQMLEANYLRQATVTLVRTPAPVPVGPAPPPPGPVLERFQIIYLAGEFITPGPLRIPENVVPTLLQTIIRSGGITPSGDLTRVKLLRIVEGQGAVEEINVSAILAGEILPTDIVLHDGDIVVIPPFAPVVYVTGNVERPGTLRLFQDETLTAYAAILRAGGFARFANLRKVYVVRDLGNGEKAHIPLNVKDVQMGRAPDVILQGKDIVVVPERFFSF